MARRLSFLLIAGKTISGFGGCVSQGAVRQNAWSILETTLLNPRLHGGWEVLSTRGPSPGRMRGGWSCPFGAEKRIRQ
jgi:hypothetical protein